MSLNSLRPLLSSGSSISYDQSTAPRWSSFHEPIAYAVVCPATEADVQKISGGHGWSRNIKLRQRGIIINMRSLNSVSFNVDRTQATIGGGCISSEVIEAACANDTQVMTGNCSTVGVLGAALGGGYGNLLGEHGFAVDQFISMNVVLADGSLNTITSRDRDLWWALRGAGPNFGIVTSAVVKAFPTPMEQNNAFLGSLFFSEDKLGDLIDRINELVLEPKMNIFLVFLTFQGSPAILATTFYSGDEAESNKAFASIHDLGPVMAQGAITPYNKWNDGAGFFNTKGGRKPGYGVSHSQLDRFTWLHVWQLFKGLVEDPAYAMSFVLCEAYSLKVAQSLEPDGPATASSFPGRHIRFNTAIVPWYTNEPGYDVKAEAFGSAARNALRKTSGSSADELYVNFAFGDESNQRLYGPATARLKELKKKYDPDHVFGAWFDIETCDRS